jgi:hypothetical protein
MSSIGMNCLPGFLPERLNQVDLETPVLTVTHVHRTQRKHLPESKGHMQTPVVADTQWHTRAPLQVFQAYLHVFQAYLQVFQAYLDAGYVDNSVHLAILSILYCL